jgi:hypothetical protein
MSETTATLILFFILVFYIGIGFSVIYKTVVHHDDFSLPEFLMYMAAGSIVTGRAYSLFVELINLN